MTALASRELFPKKLFCFTKISHSEDARNLSGNYQQDSVRFLWEELTKACTDLFLL